MTTTVPGWIDVAEDRLHRPVLTVEDAGHALEAELAVAQPGNLDDRPFGASEPGAARRCPLGWIGASSGWTTTPSGSGRVELGEVLRHRPAGHGEAVAVQQTGLEQVLHARPARHRPAPRSVMWNLPPGFMSAMCGPAPTRLKSSSSSSTPASLAMASRCSTALVEPPSAGRRCDRVLERLLRQDLAG